MPTAPYAVVRAQLDAGALQTGGITAVGGEVVHLSADPAGLGGATQCRWELLNFPPAFSLPAGWTADASGSYYSTAQTPPPFTLLTSADFDKYVPRLTLNGGGPALTGKETAAQLEAIRALTTTATAIQVLSATGLTQVARYEETQFSVRGWLEGLRADIRILAAVIGGGGTGDVTGPGASVDNRLALFSGATGKAIKQATALFSDLLLKDGTVAMTGALNLNSHKALNVTTGTASTDGVNKGQMDAADAVVLAAAGDIKSDGSVAMAADFDFGGNQASNASDAGAATDLTTLQQVQALIGAAISTIGDWKQSVRFATTAALAASTLVGSTRTANANGAFPTVDGVTAVVGDRFLDKDHATGSARGLYTLTNAGSGGTPWVATRATDFDVSAEVTAGLTVAVTEGTANGPGNTNGGNVFMLTTPDPITLGTTSLAFARIGTLLPDGVTLVVSGSVIVRAALTGDVTASQGSNATTIAAAAVTTTKIADANVTPAKMAAANAKGQSPVYNGASWAYFGVATKAADLTDANATVTVTDGNRMVLAAATLTATRNLTLGITGSPGDKEVIVVERYDTTANTYVVKNNAGTTLYTFPASVKRRASFQYFAASSDWILSGHEAITS